jgi:hypothetical protein
MTSLDETELRTALESIVSGTGKPFATCSDLASKIAAFMMEDESAAASLLQEIGAVYDRSASPALRLYIENCFLFQLGNFIFSSGASPRLLALLPANLHEILMHQMLSSGI